MVSNATEHLSDEADEDLFPHCCYLPPRPLTVGEIGTGVLLGLWGFLVTVALVALLIAQLAGRSIDW